MRKRSFIFLVLLLSFFAINTNAQQWRANLPAKSNGEYTLYDYQKAFYDYWEPYNVGPDGRYTDADGVQQRAPGYKQFKRWEWYWSPRVDWKTGAFPDEFAFDIWKDFSSNSPKSVGGTWISIGDQELDPLDEPSLQESGTGRINCAHFDPNDNNHFWVGSPAGGLWETTDGGSSWTCKTDNELILGISDIAISPNYASDNTIYIATGDRDAGDDPSLGVLKSVDDGATWFRTDLKFKASSNTQTTRVIVDPADANTIYASTSVGVYKSSDGGTTFTLKQSGNFIDMEIIPGSSSGTGTADLIATTNTASAQAWRSTDGGENWAVVLTANAANEDRMDIAVTPANSNYVYVITGWDGGALGSIYRSTNGGASFTEVYDGGTSNNLFAWDQTNIRTDGGQAFYDVALAVSATNENVVYVGGVNAFISTNGATSFVMSNRWDPAAGGSADEVHADHHNAYFRASDDRLFDCNDGGLYYTTNATAGSGANWIDITDGLVTGQLYDIGVSQTEPGSVVAGYQDNGGKYRDISTSATDWEQIREGDGMESEIDPTNVNNQWTSYPTGYVFRTTDEWASYSLIRSTLDAAWSFPIEADPLGGGVCYVGGQNVERYIGATKTTLSSINATLLTMDVYHVGSDLVIWTGGYSDLWKSNTAGGSYTSVYAGLPGNRVTDIAIDDDDYNHVYVSLGSYDYNSVYETTDGGATWTDISAGLPPVPAGAIVINEQNTSEHEIYVGTDLGVFVKVGSDDWRLFNDGFPVVSITELEIGYDAVTPSNSKLYAGTYGRDTWVSDLYSVSATPMTYVSSTTFQNNPFDVFQGTVKNEIIGIEVETSGSTSPLDISSFSFNTNGSTDAAGDISNAKLYYTGASNVFNTSNQFGTTVAGPDGNFNITGSQTLTCGKNYFWLTYDIDGAATLNNYVDAECTSITVGTAKTPTVTAPVGHRKIDAGSYCESYSSDLIEPNTYGISNVDFNTISNADGTAGHYKDFTAQSTTVNAGSSYPITVTLSTGTNTFYGAVWIDWNHDYDFDDMGESFVLGANTVDDGDVTGTIDVPVDALAGDTRMRVVSTFDDPPVSCGEYRYGETEDYTVTVVSATPMSYVSATTTQNNVANVTVGTTDAEVIGIEIVTSGALSPLDATSFTFSTNGSTNAAGDVTNAKLYYTGTSSTFATSNLFDSQASPNGGFTLTGSQTLSTGTNYFWLVYDINAGATGGNVVDAECTSLTVGTAKTPTVQAPAGNRPIVTDPCLISAFPYTQDFDAFTAHTGNLSGCQTEFAENDCWINDQTGSDDTDWTPRNGATTSNTTGPSDDHGGGGNYLYIEASTCTNHTAYLISPTFSFSGYTSASLSFWYHMYGSDMGTMSVQVSTDGGSSWSANLWSLSGDKGDTWQQANVDLSAYDGSTIKIRFIGETGANFRSDMAIDDINIDATVPGTPPTVTTQAVSDITCTTATGNGNITDLGTPNPTAHGVCWNTTGTPTTGDDLTNEGAASATGAFTSSMTSLTAGQTYYVRAYATNTAGTSYGNEVSFTTDPLPTAPTSVAATSTTICVGDNTDLTYTGGSGTTFGWYTSSCGGTHVGDGNNLTVSPATTTTYYGRWENSCGNSTCQSVTITVNPLPVAPTSVSATSTTICDGDNTDLTYTGGSGTTFGWYTSSCGGSLVGTGNNLTVSPATTTTYYGRWENSCGNSTCETVTITVTPDPTAPTSVAATSTTICEGDNTTLSYSGGSGTTFNWYTGSCGGTLIGTGDNFTVSPTTTTTYYGGWENSCGVSTCETVTISVNPLPAAAGTISGTSTVCMGDNGVAYSVAAISDATSYVWTYTGSDYTINGTGNSITIDFGAAATSGILTVYGTNACGNGTVSANYAITVNDCSAGTYNLGGLLSYDNGTHPALASQTVELYDATSTLVATTTTDGSGAYNFTGVSNGDYTVVPSIGAPFTWGGVTAMDVTVYKQDIGAGGGVVVTGLREISGAVSDGNPPILATEMTQILRRIVAIDNTFVGDWAYSDGAVTVSGADKTFDIQTLCFGDANASKSVAKDLHALNVTNSSILYVNPGDYFEIPVTVKGGVNDLSSITLNIPYNTDLMEITEVVMTNNNYEMIYSIENGVLRLAYSSLLPVNLNNDELLIIKGYAKNITSYVNLFENATGEFGDINSNQITDISIDLPSLLPATTAVKELGDDVNIYPNPVNSYLTLVNAKSSKFEIINIMGQVLISNEVKADKITIDTKNLNPGTYLIRIYRGDDVVTRKFTVIK